MELMLSRIDFSSQSRTVNTEIMQNMPIVIPKSDRNVRNLLVVTALIANKNPSLNSLNDIFYFLRNKWKPKVKKSFDFPEAVARQ